MRAAAVGHSSGANIALQLAIDAPQRVHSLALLEPALPVGASSERLLSTRQAAMAPVFESYRKGDKAAAMDGFMRTTGRAPKQMLTALNLRTGLGSGDASGSKVEA